MQSDESKEKKVNVKGEKEGTEDDQMQNDVKKDKKVDEKDKDNDEDEDEDDEESGEWDDVPKIEGIDMKKENIVEVAQPTLVEYSEIDPSVQE